MSDEKKKADLGSLGAKVAAWMNELKEERVPAIAIVITENGPAIVSNMPYPMAMATLGATLGTLSLVGPQAVESVAEVSSPPTDPKNLS